MTYTTKLDAMEAAKELANKNYSSSVQVLERDGMFVVDFKELTGASAQYL